MSAPFRIIVAMILLKANKRIESKITVESGGIADDSLYFQEIANYLPIAIELYSDSRQFFCGQDTSPNKIMISLFKFPTSDAIEYVSIQHNHFFAFNQTNDLNLLSNFPFVYTVPGKTIPEILKLFSEIMNQNKWRFSKEEIIMLKPQLKEFKKIPDFQESANLLLKLMKNDSCEHNFKFFGRFSCGEIHCIQCMRDEISLKSLEHHQIFCECKIKAKDDEIYYYFGISHLKVDNNSNGNMEMQHNDHLSEIKIAENAPYQAPPESNDYSEPYIDQISPISVSKPGSQLPESLPFSSNPGPPSVPGVHIGLPPQGTSMPNPQIPTSTGANPPFPGIPPQGPSMQNIPIPPGPNFSMSGTSTGANPQFQGISTQGPLMPNPPGPKSSMPGAPTGAIPPFSVPTQNPLILNPSIPGGAYGSHPFIGTPPPIPRAPMPAIGPAPSVSTISKLKFCSKCKMPIRQNEENLKDGKNYHKTCLN